MSFHLFRTVFWLIPAIAVYTIVLGTLSLGSTLVGGHGLFAHWCARAWSWLILVTTGVRVEVRGLDQLTPGATYVFAANHQSIYDIPVMFGSLPFQLRIIAKESLGRFPFLGWHLRRTGHMLVDRRRPDRAAHLHLGDVAAGARAVAHRVPRRHPQPRRACRRVQGRQPVSRRAGRHPDRAAVGGRQPARDAQGRVDDAARRRRAGGSPAGGDAGRRRSERPR